MKSAILRWLSIAFLLTGMCPPSIAANMIEVWDQPENIPLINQFYFDLRADKNLTLTSFRVNDNRRNPQQFKLLNSYHNNHTWHARFNQYYQGIPIWGAQIIMHQKKKTKITGILATEIYKDIHSFKTHISEAEAFLISVRHLRQQNTHHSLSTKRLLNIRKYIYIDTVKNTTTGPAKLVYRVTYFIDDLTKKKLLNPVFLIDANSGKVLMHYDNIKKVDAVGTGPGGNDLTQAQNSYLPRESNTYQFGQVTPNIPAFGNLPVSVDAANSLCTMETNIANIRSWHNNDFDEDAFPITYAQESAYPIFNYQCSAASNYQNLNDGGESPIINHNYVAYSPNNDCFYFANQTYAMLRNYLPDVENPWGTSLPLRIYTHIANYDNAGAYSPPDPGEEPAQLMSTFPPQFVVGNGETVNYPLSDSGTVAHELAHIFTGYASNLIYAEQSGALNEAYSDISGATFDAYLNALYPWYGFNWAIGPSVSLPSGPDGGKASRYMNDPPLDGKSIGNAAQFVPGMDVHFSSGVYNKAFYLAVAQFGIDIATAFKYFSYANLNYWTPSTGYSSGSCGVMQAAIDFGNRDDFNKLVLAFSMVGVTCKIGLTQLTTVI